jgi:hypothetical protein
MPLVLATGEARCWAAARGQVQLVRRADVIAPARVTREKKVGRGKEAGCEAESSVEAAPARLDLCVCV